LQDESVPEWLKPTLSNVIVQEKHNDQFSYVVMSYAGETISSSVLSWFILWGMAKGCNIVWYNEYNSRYFIGDQKFIDAMNSGMSV
jgi:hypothetical protein